MENKLKVLLIAYACKPNSGSESGVGWNTSIEASRFHDVFVFTHHNNKVHIEEELKKNNYPNLNIYYFKLPNSLSFIGKYFGMRMDYFFWNLFSIKYLNKKDKESDFDVIHHITFNQYRSPSFGFFTTKPFVFGPVGGAETINRFFFKDLNFFMRIKEYYRKSKIDVWFFSLLFKIKTNKKIVLYSSYENYKKLNFKSKTIIDSIAYHAIGYSKKDFLSTLLKINNTNTFNMIYAGRAEDWKGLHFLFRALNIVKEENINLKLVGIRNLEERAKIEKWINNYSIKYTIEIIDFIPRNELLSLLDCTNLFVYPAFRDSGSMSILEASVVGCPTICLKVGGQDILPEKHFLLVEPTKSYDETVEKFAKQIIWAFNNRAELKTIGLSAQKYVSESFQWHEKMKFYNEIYKKL
jgi:glycosyltransferase involved in cell wall biosynthesis